MWVNKYIGEKWTEEKDCGYWFRLIQKKQFNRDIPIICNIPATPEKFCRQAMHLMKAVTENIKELNWKETKNPIEGDAVMLAIKTHIHHIGIVVFVENQLHILHAIKQCGVILSDKSNLRLNGLHIMGYFSYGS